MNKLLSLLVFLSSTTALADLPVYYWDNQEKLVEAHDRCRIETVSNQEFRISKYYSGKANDTSIYENLRNLGGVKQSYVANGSLVKVLDRTKKKHNYLVELVGVNQSIKRNRWYSERGDKGYLFYRSVLPLDDYVLKVANSDLDGIEQTHLSDRTETYWSIASGKSFFKLKCPELSSKREYILFKVYAENSLAPEMLVAVSKEETSNFKNINTLSKYDVHNILPNFLQASQDIDYVNLRMRLKKMTDSDESLEAERVRVDINNKSMNHAVGSIEDVVCTSTNYLNVRTSELDKVVFKANQGERVKVYQGWDDIDKKKTIGGVEYTYKKVKFSQREGQDQSVGWVASRFIMPKSKCSYLNGNKVILEIPSEISGLDDPNCCEFPTVKKVTHRFDSGMRRFKAGRSGGRFHAACDLYRYENEEILSVAPGKVIQGVQYFYLGTYSLVIEHSGGFVVRYGEITSKEAKNVSLGKTVTMGQRIGYIGQVNLNVRPMLHFELYDGSQTGPLTVRGSKTGFQRRSDLMDPTSYLLDWEESSF